MAGKIFDYSKWDKIELSDDESDLHPNIDKESWFRLKHRTRLEREEKEDQEVKEAEKLNKEDQARLNIINARLKGLQSGEAEDAEFEDTEALEGEAAELSGRINERLKRIADIKERRKWNIDNICTVKDEKSLVSKGQASSLKAKDFQPTGQTEAVLGERKATENPPPAPQGNEKASVESASSLPPAPARAPTSSTSSSAKSAGPSRSDSPSRERFAVVAYNDFVLLHEKTLEDYSEIHDLEATKEFLFKNCDILLHEHAQSYMLLSSLEDEMNGKLERMKLVSRQSQILSHIHELGVSMNRDPRDVILPFFKRIEEKEYLNAFLSAVQDFIAKIKKRAIEKRREMDAERGEVQVGPGGLDPYEVLESLPTTLRDAFESQDIERLQEVLASMNPAEAKYHMKRCVDSGLWVPNDSSVFEE